VKSKAKQAVRKDNSSAFLKFDDRKYKKKKKIKNSERTEITDVIKYIKLFGK